MGSAGIVVESEASDHGGAYAQIAKNRTKGNVCRMRIIIDKFLLKLFDNNKEKMKAKVKYFEMSLNDIYKEGDVSVKVNNNWLPLKFKVVDLQFHDEAYCQRKGNSPGIA